MASVRSVRSVRSYSSSSVINNDRISYLGAKIPPEVEVMVRHVKDLDKETFRKILKAAAALQLQNILLAAARCKAVDCSVLNKGPQLKAHRSHASARQLCTAAHLNVCLPQPALCCTGTARGSNSAVVGALEGKDCREAVKVIQQNTSLSEEQLSFIIAGAYTLLRVALRLPVLTLKQEAFKEDLKELRIPDDFIGDFSNIVYGNRRPILEDSALKQEIRLPTVEDLRWRVDVAISTSSLSRALQPSILMQMKLSNGESHRFEVSVAKFQELRYNVALILKEMNDLEKKNILKIQD